ncbi:hypothetical protein G9C98_005141 [Cotesia typhae]|uniref:Uncharacterized protein n=1 Tax=Cotesia typhae TaxID=2053667 RepID=A0A8J5R5M1_9HYME|nr:hypothetical protein G9C98_005141 [Cotesia typhae]
MIHVGLFLQSRPSFVTDEMIAMAASVVNACQRQTGVATADIEAVRNGQWPESRQLKCYLKCIFDQFRLVSKRGINFDAMLALSPPSMKESAAKMVKECREIKGKEGDLCDLSYEVTKCLYNSNPETYFIL